jgi:multidrug efflux pump subunit AcrB
VLVNRLDIDPDRANLAGLTNADVAASSAAAINGTQVAVLREDKQADSRHGAPAAARAPEIGDLRNLYVFHRGHEQGSHRTGGEHQLAGGQKIRRRTRCA